MVVEIDMVEEIDMEEAVGVRKSLYLYSEFCGEAFGEAGGLKRHIRTHEGRKDYKYDFTKIFKVSSLISRNFCIIVLIHNHFLVSMNNFVGN